MCEWTYKTVRELCSQVIDCRNKTAPVVDYPTPYKMLRTSNIRDGFVDVSSVRYVLKPTYDIWTSRGELEDGDVIFTREAPLGEVGILRKASGYFLGQRLVLFRANPQKCYNWFLNYALLCPWIKNKICGSGGGSIVTHLRVPDCEEIQIRIPADLSEQKRIADTLRVIDEKIELNRQLNDNLEAMAQALYDYWFVQFDFPDENGKPYKSSGGKMVWNEVLKREIPEGWTNSTVQDYIKIGNGKDHKSVGSGEIPCYGSGGFMFGVAKAIYTGESVLLPRKGSLNNVMLVDGSFWTVDTMFYSEPKMKGAAKYVYYGIQVYDLASMNLGTGVPSMTSTRLYSLKLVGAPYTILAKFDVVVSPLLSKARRLLAENKVLAAQRDFLLPLLMNGQVQVKPQGELNYRLADD